VLNNAALLTVDRSTASRDDLGKFELSLAQPDAKNRITAITANGLTLFSAFILLIFMI